MRKSIIDRLTALEPSVKDIFRNEAFHPPIDACMAALGDAFPGGRPQSGQLAHLVQRIKAGAATSEDQSVLDAIPKTELNTIGMTALQFIEVALYLKETC